jgi:hypothetical protein
MKSRIQLAVIVALSAPLISFAQSTAPLTREQVKADFLQLEQIGGRSAITTNDFNYPQAAQAGEARVAAYKAATGQASTGRGGTASGSSSSGSVASVTGLRSVYSGF